MRRPLVRQALSASFSLCLFWIRPLSHGNSFLMLFRDSSFVLLYLIISLSCLRGSPFSYVHAQIFGNTNFSYSVCLNCFS